MELLESIINLTVFDTTWVKRMPRELSKLDLDVAVGISTLNLATHAVNKSSVWVVLLNDIGPK